MRIVARFESRPALIAAVEEARAAGATVVSARMPTDDPTLTRLLAVRFFAGPTAVAGGMAAAAATLWFGWRTVMAWPRIIGGKPLFSWPTELLVAFEIGVLGAVLATVAAFAAYGWQARRRLRPFRLSPADGPFALMIACAPDRGEHITALLGTLGSASWRIA
jgi:hypothetical protein